MKEEVHVGNANLGCVKESRADMYGEIILQCHEQIGMFEMKTKMIQNQGPACESESLAIDGSTPLSESLCELRNRLIDLNSKICV